MPAGKRQQSNTMLYTVVVFVALFLVSTVFAVVFYIRSEDYRNREDKLQRDMDSFATRGERSQVGNLIGDKAAGMSYLRTAFDHHNRTVGLILGQPTDDESSIEIKTGLVANRTQEAIDKAQPLIDFETVDPNIGLIPVVEKLVDALTVAGKTTEALEQQVAEMQKLLDSASEAGQANAELLETEKVKYQEQANEVLQRYEELKLAWEQSGDDRADSILERLEREQATAQELKNNLSKTQVQLDDTHSRMAAALEDLRKVTPVPSLEAITFMPDGKITLVDEVGGIVYINLGSDDRIYQGLTFSVYDKARAIPKDGKSKAEVEVYKVQKTSAAARIVSRDPRNPIATDDVVANLIWERGKTHEFVITGDFDLDGDGFEELDASERIANLIRRWGGRIAEDVSANTHVVLLGLTPKVPEKRPDFDVLEVDPRAQDRYDEAKRRFQAYQEVHDNAKTLMIPMYKYDKFLYLIGYKGSVAKPGAFL